MTKDNRITEALLSLADPEATNPPPKAIDPAALSALALHHRVGSTVARKIGERLFGSEFKELRDAVETLAALSLALQTWQARLHPAFVAAGVRANLVKGLDFATALYPALGDRPFTDLDILCHPDDAAAVASILTKHGLTRDAKRSARRAEALTEQKWRHADQPWLLIETHLDLVHYPGLRRRVSFDWAAATDGGAVTPTGRFFIAVAHGALGHKFHELRLVIDVLQAFRRLSPAERLTLPARAAALGLEFETRLALDILARLYDPPDAATIRDALPDKGSAATAWLDRDTLLGDGSNARARIRRHGVRAVQRMVRR